MSTTDDEFRQLLNNMIQGRVSEVARLLDLREKGITVGAPTVDDLIQREQGAVDNLQNALDLFNRLSR